MFVSVRACNNVGFYSTVVFNVKREEFERLLRDNNTFYFTAPADRHYVLTNIDVTGKHVYVNFPLAEFRITNNVYYWGSQINYKKAGFVVMMIHDTEPGSLIQTIRVPKNCEFSRFFENWSSDSDEDELKCVESDEDL